MNVFDPRSQCGKKKGYLKRSKAKRAARRLKERLEFEDGEEHVFSVYRCPWCELWHFGHRMPHLYRGIE